MQIKFYSGFDKKQNSTKQPAVSQTSVTLTGTLKQDCSVMNPIIQIKRTADDSVPSIYTYAYIDDFDRYYFVTDWTWNQPFWECSMNVDVLASHRSAIGSLTAFVLRADTEVYDELITDMMYPATNEFYLDQYTLQSVFTDNPVSGIYIVGIISGASGVNSVGAISYYAMTSTEFGLLKSALLTNSNLSSMGMLDANQAWDMTDMSEEIFKTMYNPFQYIASCMWFPFGLNSIPSDKKEEVHTIPIGWWDYTLDGYKISAQTLEFGEGPGAIYQHPQALTHGKYMNYAPFTRCTVFGRFGVIPLDLSYFGEESDSISISYYVDLINGQCRARVETYKAAGSPRVYHPIAEQHFLLGVPIQLAQIGIDYLGAAVTAIDATAKTAENALSLNVGGAVSAAANGIYNTLNAAMPQMATSGVNGSFLAPSTWTTVVFQYFHAVGPDIEHKGRPVCSTRIIGQDLGGYVLCADGDFDIDCLSEERTLIANYLTSGFFWE